MKNYINKITQSKWTGIALAAVGILMMAFGIYRGEMEVVFTKSCKYLYGVYWNWMIRK